MVRLFTGFILGVVLAGAVFFYFALTDAQKIEHLTKKVQEWKKRCGYVEEQLKGLLNEKELALKSALFMLACGRLEPARKRFAQALEGFEKAIAELSAPPRKVYDPTVPRYHYARLWLGMAEPIKREAHKREFLALLRQIDVLYRSRRWEEAKAAIEDALSERFADVRDEKTEEALQAKLDRVEAKLAAKRPDRKGEDLLAALKKYLHAASIRRRGDFFEVVYDFRKPEQMYDFLYNDRPPVERVIDRRWTCLLYTSPSPRDRG